jgi:LuxR family maltose regulon positive regulatory protein
VATEAPTVLLDTKLNPPTLRDAVERPRLVAAFAASSERLKLVRAPAGWGKTTLVAAWLQSAEEDRPFAWLSLDPWDDDPTRFWLYVIEALRGISSTIGDTSLPLLTAPGTSVETEVLPALINELAELPEPAVLVLDDYHAIRNPEIHSQLSLLLERLPESLEVIVNTRTDPPLPLPRMRARGELMEIDVEGLRFDDAEAQELLNRVLDLSLEPEDAIKLRDRTEGWAAGLYLAALSLRVAEDRSSFVDDFAGDDRNVVDYLGSEVLAAQPQRLREVLLRTSILERFCAPLVEAVTGASDGAGLLREIERANLFLVPLDTRREWFRYHHLFQQLLRLELSFAEPDAEPELHRRAAAWHLEAGNVPEGIRHTIAAGDTETAGELIARHWAPTLLGAAGDRTVDSWLSALGDEAVAADLRLCFARCFIDLSYGDMDGVARWLAIAERAPLAAPFREGLISREGALAVVRTAYLWELGDVSAPWPPARRRSRPRGRERPGAGSAPPRWASRTGRSATSRRGAGGPSSTRASAGSSGSISTRPRGLEPLRSSTPSAAIGPRPGSWPIGR